MTSSRILRGIHRSQSDGGAGADHAAEMLAKENEMHIVSDSSLKRPGYIYRDGIGYPADRKPEIVWTHVDGPLLRYSDGQLHWLTLWERILCKLGMHDAHSLERKRRCNN